MKPSGVMSRSAIRLYIKTGYIHEKGLRWWRWGLLLRLLQFRLKQETRVCWDQDFSISLWDPPKKTDIFLFESLTSMKARSAHQLLPVRTRPQQGVQRYHGSVVAAASRPAWQTEALVGFVSLSWTVGGGPHRGAPPVRDAPLIQIPVEKTSWSSFSL